MYNPSSLSGVISVYTRQLIPLERLLLDEWCTALDGELSSAPAVLRQFLSVREYKLRRMLLLVHDQHHVAILQTCCRLFYCLHCYPAFI